MEEIVDEARENTEVREEVKIDNIDSEESSEELIALIKKEKELAFLLDCDYHHPMWTKLKGIYIKVKDKVFYLGVGREDYLSIRMDKEPLRIRPNKQIHS